MHAIPHVTLGKRHVRLDAPSHIGGVAEGNAPYQVSEVSAQRGQRPGRSTGVNAKQREPIDPSMPKLTPA